METIIEPDLPELLAPDDMCTWPEDPLLVVPDMNDK